MPAKKTPSGKKLVSLHIDGKSVGATAEFVATVLFAAAQRKAGEYDKAGNPTFHVNSAGDLCIYVNDWTV